VVISPRAIPHSIQGLPDDGCEFLLVFDDGNFSEEETFLLSGLDGPYSEGSSGQKLRGWRRTLFDRIPEKDLWIFQASVPGPRWRRIAVAGAGPVPHTFSHRMLAQEAYPHEGRNRANY